MEALSDLSDQDIRGRPETQPKEASQRTAGRGRGRVSTALRSLVSCRKSEQQDSQITTYVTESKYRGRKHSRSREKSPKNGFAAKMLSKKRGSQ